MLVSWVPFRHPDAYEQSTNANFWLGFAFAAASTAEAIRNPVATMMPHFCASNAEMFFA